MNILFTLKDFPIITHKAPQLTGLIPELDFDIVRTGMAGCITRDQDCVIELMRLQEDRGHEHERLRDRIAIVAGAALGNIRGPQSYALRRKA